MWKIIIKEYKGQKIESHKIRIEVVKTNLLSDISSSSSDDCDIDTDKVFLYNASDVAVSVCTVSDILEYPENGIIDDHVFYRKNYVDVITRNVEVQNQMIDVLTKHLQALREALVIYRSECHSGGTVMNYDIESESSEEIEDSDD